MELISTVRGLGYLRKLLLGDTKNILPFPVRAQKPAPEARPGTALPRMEHDAAGVPAAALDAFYRRLAADPHIAAHCALVLRHGSVVGEAGFAPYSTADWHVTHSLCKSFTGTAVGLLCGEGRLDPGELVCDILPEKCSLLTSKRMRALTVRHLLEMRSGSEFREMGCVLEKDWASAFLASDLAFDPGARFDYNSMNSYMLSAIVQKKTGKNLMEYLAPRLFAPLGFGSVAWETCPLGVCKGGWGMYVRPEDAAKLALLYLNGGMWNGRRILSEDWVRRATATQAHNECGEAYGWQLWTHDGDTLFQFNGMFGQYAVAAPELDMVVVLFAGSGHFFTQGPSFGCILGLLDDVRAADAAGFVRSTAREKKELAWTLAHLRFGAAVPDYAAAHGFAPWLHGAVASLGPTRAQRAREEMAQRREAACLPQTDADKARYAAARQAALAAGLPPQTALLAGRAWRALSNSTSLLPFVLCAMNDYYTPGTARVAFRIGAAGGGDDANFWMDWTEGDVTQHVPVGFGAPVRTELRFGGNRFAVASEGHFARDEDGQAVFGLTLNFLEETSTQRVKLYLDDDGVRLMLRETPSLPYVAQLLNGANSDALQLNKGIFKDLEYLRHKVRRACWPELELEEEPLLQAAQGASAAAAASGAQKSVSASAVPVPPPEEPADAMLV